MASNQDTLDDEDGESSDWIELFNSGSTPVDLDGWYLSDDTALLTKWQIPDVTLGGGVSITGVSTGDFIDFMVDTGPADADGNDGTNYQFTIDRIPEPSAMVLLLGGFAFALRRRRQTVRRLHFCRKGSWFAPAALLPFRIKMLLVSERGRCDSFAIMIRRALQPMLLFSLALLTACGKKESATTPREGEAAVPGTEVELLPDDPGEGGWETESWSAAIQTQLNRIKSALLDGNIESALAGVEGEGCQSTRLVPQKREEFGDRVSRLPAGTEEAPAESFAQALVELRELFSQSPRHASAKIVGISSAGNSKADTRVAFQIDAAGIQVNSQWDCRWQQEGRDWKLASIRLAEFEEVRVPAGAFADATESAAGQDATLREQFYRSQDHWMARIEMRMGIDISGWQGLAIADIDGDGLEDIYVSQPGGLPNRLYRHRPDGTLEDVSAKVGVDWLDTTHGSLFADLDNDGDPDLLVGAADGIIVMENHGGFQFEVVATKLLPAGLAYSIAAADIDQDSDLDFFVCGYTPRAGVSRHHVFVHPVPFHDANNGGRNALFRNDGDWRFTDVTRATGMDEKNTRFSYAATWEDYDLDGDLDLYLANDFGRNSLYRNDFSQSGRVRFTDVADEAGVVDIAPGMSACWGDYNNDGHADLYVGNMFSSAGNRIAIQPEFLAGADAETRGEFLRHAGGNSLFKNTGDGKFADVGKKLGVSGGRWAWSSKFADLDNDGWQDIVVANGFITQEDTGDL